MRGLGLDFFGEPCGARIDSSEYFTVTPTYRALQGVVEDTVEALLSGGGTIDFCGEFLANVPNMPGVSAVFGSHEDTARLIAATVLATLIEREKKKRSGWLSALSLAQALVPEITGTLQHGGDPTACQMEFDTTFRSWTGLTSLSVPTTVSKTGWCEKWLTLPLKPDGHIASCKALAVCRVDLLADGRSKIREVPPPPATDPRAVVAAPGTEPAPPPTKAEIEAEIRRKMSLPGGGSLAEQETKQEFIELAGYLQALGEARRYLTLALGIPEKATDAVLASSLAREGISPGEVLDWFEGCNFDANCFRQRMNKAIGEARRYARDTRAKIVVAAAAVGILGFFLLGRGR